MMKVLSALLPLLSLSAVAWAGPATHPGAIYDENEFSAVSREFFTADQSPHHEGLILATLEQRDIARQCNAVVVGVAASITAQAAIAFVDTVTDFVSIVCHGEGNEACARYIRAGLDAYHAVIANGRRSIGSSDHYLSMMDLLGQDIYGFDSLHNLTMGAADVKRRNNQPALVSSVALETEGHDFAIHHWDNGMGQLHLSHDGFSDNGIPLSNKYKRFGGKGFKIAFHKVASNNPESSFVDAASIELSRQWYRYIKQGADKTFGFVEVRNQADSCFRTIAEIKGFGLNYEDVDVCGDISQYIGQYLGPN